MLTIPLAEIYKEEKIAEQVVTVCGLFLKRNLWI
jgi:hypothetical protein